MKKFILGAVAAGALAIGGAASAQGILDNIFGNGYGYPNQVYSQSQPAVVAGTVPYGSQMYSDAYGRQFYYDQYGRQVYVQASTSNYGIVGYDAWGRPVYGTTTNVYGSNNYGGYAYNRGWDRDGDGIANTRDRWPDDSRYW